jgi:hypothetical protein
MLLLLLFLFLLTANGFLTGGSATTIRHSTQMTHITQNNTTVKRNTARRSAHSIHTLHKMNKLSLDYLYLYKHVRFQIFTAVIIKNSIFRDIIPRNMLKFTWRFGGPSRFHFQRWRVSQARNRHEIINKFRMSCSLPHTGFLFGYSTMKLG